MQALPVFLKPGLQVASGAPPPAFRVALVTATQTRSVVVVHAVFCLTSFAPRQAVQSVQLFWFAEVVKPWALPTPVAPLQAAHCRCAVAVQSFVMYRPAAQAVHAAQACKFWAVLYVPAAQAWQVLFRLTVQVLPLWTPSPAGHFVQGLHFVPSVLYVLPVAHASQPVCAPVGPVTPDPAGHAAHTRFCVVVVEQAVVW